MLFQQSVVLSGRGGKFGDGLASSGAVKMSPIAFAQRRSTGRNSLRYTFPSYACSRGPADADVLDRDPRSTAVKRNCAATHAVSILRLESGVLGLLAKGTPNVGGVKRGAELSREDEIVVGPSCRAAEATPCLPTSMRSKRDYAIVREFQGAPRHSRLGVPAASSTINRCRVGWSQTVDPLAKDGISR